MKQKEKLSRLLESKLPVIICSRILSMEYCGTQGYDTKIVRQVKKRLVYLTKQGIINSFTLFHDTKTKVFRFKINWDNGSTIEQDIPPATWGCRVVRHDNLHDYGEDYSKIRRLVPGIRERTCNSPPDLPSECVPVHCKNEILDKQYFDDYYSMQEQEYLNRVNKGYTFDVTRYNLWQKFINRKWDVLIRKEE